MIVLDDGRMRVEVAPERGAEIRFAGRSGGDNVLAFYDWAAPQPAGAAPLGYGDPELDWLSGYRGGWQEVFPNAGAPCTVAGVPLPMHGEASVAPWEVLAADARSATLRVAARLPLVLERRMTLDPDRAALRIEETVTNESDLEMPFLLGHHPAFEALPGMQIDLPGARIEPIPAEGVVREGDAFHPRRPEGWAALRDAAGGRGIALAWDLETMPDVWVWHEIGGTSMPFYGRSRIVAVEPMTHSPGDGLAAAVAAGSAHLLAGRATHTSWLTLALFDADERPVRGVARDGRVSR